MNKPMLRVDRRLLQQLVNSDVRMQKTHASDNATARAHIALLLLICANKGQLILKAKEIHALCLNVHHGGNRHDIRKAKDILRRAKLPNDLLYKQMTDRVLVMQYKHQKFGTQFRSNQRGENLGAFPFIKNIPTKNSHILLPCR